MDETASGLSVIDRFCITRPSFLVAECGLARKHPLPDRHHTAGRLGRGSSSGSSTGIDRQQAVGLETLGRRRLRVGDRHSRR